jgi:hypothetical protein
MPAIPAFGRITKFKASWGYLANFKASRSYIVRAYFKSKTTATKKYKMMVNSTLPFT